MNSFLLLKTKQGGKSKTRMQYWSNLHCFSD